MKTKEQRSRERFRETLVTQLSTLLKVSFTAGIEVVAAHHELSFPNWSFCAGVEPRLTTLCHMTTLLITTVTFLAQTKAHAGILTLHSLFCFCEHLIFLAEAERSCFCFFLDDLNQVLKMLHGTVFR